MDTVEEEVSLLVSIPHLGTSQFRSKHRGFELNEGMDTQLQLM
jgi:hypothetical protein